MMSSCPLEKEKRKKKISTVPTGPRIRPDRSSIVVDHDDQLINIKDAPEATMMKYQHWGSKMKYPKKNIIQ